MSRWLTVRDRGADLMTPKQREAATLLLLEGLTPNQIAGRLGITRTAANRRLENGWWRALEQPFRAHGEHRPERRAA